jgi:hypothetical protein
MIHLKKGDKVRVLCDGQLIDTATAETVDRRDNVIFVVYLTCDRGGSCALNYEPMSRYWFLYVGNGWTARRPNGSKYDLEVIPEDSEDTVVIDGTCATATTPKGAD